jgi:hypothetical protein
MKTATRTTKAIEKASDEYDAKITALLADLKAEIEGLPDNPRISRLGDGKCFTMSFSDLGDNWSAGYHDFKSQYRLVVEELEKVADPRNILKRLRRVVEDESIRINNGYQYTQRLHPDVVAHLKGLL